MCEQSTTQKKQMNSNKNVILAITQITCKKYDKF